MQPMESLQPMQSNPNLNRRRDILLLIFGGISILGLLIRSVTLAFTGIRYLAPGDAVSLASNMLDSLAMLFCAGLLLPLLVFTMRHLKGQEILPAFIQPVKFWLVTVLLVLWVFTVIIGAVLASLFNYGWAVAAPMFLLGISLPILIFAWLGVGGLPCGSRRRLWSVFGISMVGSAIAAVLLEYLVVGVAAAIITLIAVANPELRAILEQIKTLVANTKGGDMQTLLTGLAPYLSNPLVLVAILAFAAVIAPIIEESLKPAVIWFLGKRLRSPAEGFVLGVLCGAGFAMMEGLMSVSGASQMWGFGLAGRAAASLMHITASGFLGWGIASARLEKRYLRLALTCLLAVSIHGLWNGSVILVVFGALQSVGQGTQIHISGALFMLGGLGVLFMELVLMIAVLPLINRYLRRSTPPVSVPVQSDIIAPLSTSK